jgi:hypothetical protein
MDILWMAVSAGIFIVFGLLIIAWHWHERFIRGAIALNALRDRLAALEEIADPERLRRLEKNASSPLERVYTISIQFGNRFWKDTLQLPSEAMAFVRMSGTFLGSIKIECWRTHSIATMSEVLPSSKSASWQTRSVDIYAGDSRIERGGVSLWTLAMHAPQLAAPARFSELELRLERNAVALYAKAAPSSAGFSAEGGESNAEELLTAIPLSPVGLAKYRATDEEPELETGFEAVPPGNGSHGEANSRTTVFEHRNEEQGIDWRLSLREFVLSDDPRRAKVLEVAGFRQTG